MLRAINYLLRHAVNEILGVFHISSEADNITLYGIGNEKLFLFF